MGRRYLPLVGVISVIAFILITSNLIYAQEKSDKKEDSKKADTEDSNTAETEDDKTVETEKKGELLNKAVNTEKGKKLFSKKEQTKEGEKTDSRRFSFSGTAWTMVLSLVVIVALIGLLYYLFRKYLPSIPRVRSGKAIQFLARRYLDPRNSIALIKIGKRVLLIGITAEGMSLLSEIADEEEVQDIMDGLTPEQVASKHGSFVDILRNTFRRSEPTQEENELSKIGVEVEKVRKQVENLNRREN